MIGISPTACSSQRCPLSNDRLVTAYSLPIHYRSTIYPLPFGCHRLSTAIRRLFAAHSRITAYSLAMLTHCFPCLDPAYLPYPPAVAAQTFTAGLPASWLLTIPDTVHCPMHCPTWCPIMPLKFPTCFPYLPLSAFTALSHSLPIHYLLCSPCAHTLLTCSFYRPQ
jgi:hypothetical protein